MVFVSLAADPWPAIGRKQPGETVHLEANAGGRG